jgi:methionine-rich copper-binding protein CopC
MTPLSLFEQVQMRLFMIFIVTAIAIGLCAPTTFAHAKLLRTQPESNATLKQPPQTVELWFNEELQQQFNAITVTDQSGRRVATGALFNRAVTAVACGSRSSVVAEL